MVKTREVGSAANRAIYIAIGVNTEGQKPEDFPKTFLSLSEKNKEGIPFVQGKFNMGSTGSLRFCTRSNRAYPVYCQS